MKASTDRYYNLFAPRFWLGQLDLRPLGLMRIVFGLALFWSVIDLAPVLLSFFSDGGVAPRSALLGTLTRSNRVSLYDFTGPYWVLVVFFIATLLSILALTVGWHSRLASVAAFLLVCGLHERNLLVFDGSDNVIRVMLFWLMFMPTGARYSVDAVLRASRGQPLVTHAPALPMRIGQVQVSWIYLNTIIHKWPGVEWHNGTALRIALGLDHLFTRWPGHLLFNQRWFIWLGTHFTVVLECAFLPLVFLPWARPARGALARWPAWLFQPTLKGLALVGGAALHLGIALTMSVGNFSLIMISTYPLLFEAEWAEAMVRGFNWTRLWGEGTTTVLYDGECAGCSQLAGRLRGFDVYRRLQLVNFRERGALAGIPASLSKTALDQKIHIIEPDGAVRSGWSALIRIARRVPVLLPFGFIGLAPGLRQLGEPLYAKLARHRQLLMQPSAPLPNRWHSWAELLPPWLFGWARGLVWFALAFLMVFCMWFSFPDVAKIPALRFRGRQYTKDHDVSPSKMPGAIHEAIQELELWQKWNMFSPKPLDVDEYMEGRGQLTDGTQVDVLRGDRGNRSGPLLPPITPGWFFDRWTKYLNNIEEEPTDSPWTLEFGRFICRQWNGYVPAGRAQLKTFKLFKEVQKVPLFDEARQPWEEKLVWDHKCF